MLVGVLLWASYRFGAGGLDVWRAPLLLVSVGLVWAIVEAFRHPRSLAWTPARLCLTLGLIGTFLPIATALLLFPVGFVWTIVEIVRRPSARTAWIATEQTADSDSDQTTALPRAATTDTAVTSARPLDR